MAYGPELVVPNVTFDGPAHLVYAFTGENDDGGVRYVAAEPMPAGRYAYSFECLTIEGDTPMHVRLCDQAEFEGGNIRGATAPGLFSGEVEVSEEAAGLYPDSILLCVTGTPTIATSRHLSVKRIID